MKRTHGASGGHQSGNIVLPGMGRLLDRKPGTLSGGSLWVQMKSVALMD
jgi:hypothetical protein